MDRTLLAMAHADDKSSTRLANDHSQMSQISASKSLSLLINLENILLWNICR